MERHPGLMGRPDPADGTDLLEEKREGQDPESHGARSGSGPRARGTRLDRGGWPSSAPSGPRARGTHCGCVDGVVE